MPDGRFLSKSIAYSAQVGRVSLEADYLFTRMIPHLDSAGRMSGEPLSIKAQCCPLRSEITPEVVEECLVELALEGLVYWYAGPDGTRHLDFPGFHQHQRGARLEREAPTVRPSPTDDNCVLVRRTPDNSGEVRVSKEKLSEVKRSIAGADATRGGKPDKRRTARESWLLPIGAVWERHKGAGTFPWGKAGRLLKPLHEAGKTGDEIAANLDRYIPVAGKYVNFARFAETFGDYDALRLSKPPVEGGWFSDEIQKLAGLVA